MSNMQEKLQNKVGVDSNYLYPFNCSIGTLLFALV